MHYFWRQTEVYHTKLVFLAQFKKLETLFSPETKVFGTIGSPRGIRTASDNPQIEQCVDFLTNFTDTQALDISFVICSVLAYHKISPACIFSFGLFLLF